MSQAEQDKVNMKKILDDAKKRAFRGGLAGSMAMVIQVGSMMWLRTTMNYQYRHGTTTTQALKHLYNDGGRGFGGIRRFYRGLLPALFQGPLSRFGDTAANSGVLAFLDANEGTKDLPIMVKTVAASMAAGLWRIFLMPIDTTKTIMQVEGKKGFPGLVKKVGQSGPKVLYHGALASASATFVGHYPWFATFNFLQEKIEVPDEQILKLARNAAIGFTSSVVSDTCSNSIRVVKVYRQTALEPVTYPNAVRQIIASDGLGGLFGRGLKTRILTNGLQGLIFSVLWKLFEEKLNKRDQRNSK